ncbi:MAG: radical SAM protein [Gemmatimonadales bacterium]
MNVLLISPTALDSDGRPIKQRRTHLPGLTLPALAAVTPPHVRLKLVNETVGDIPYDEDWDLVGLTGMGSGIVRAWQIADEFKRRGTSVVIGGIAASLSDPELSLRHADAVVIGEAEELWPKLLEDFEAGRLQQIYRTTVPPPIDTLPVPRYDLLNRWKIGLWRPVQATRGCPYTCSFCSVTAFFNGCYRKRPVDQVVRDVRVARRFGTRHIAFIDDNIAVDWDYCTALWEALIPEKIVWMSQCSLHIADRPDMLELAYTSGCRVLSFGIESTNLSSLRTIDKAWNRPERYPDAVRTIRSHGIDVSTEMMIGLDADDRSVFQRTYDFIIDNAISVPRVHIITPVPGTPLYDELKHEGRILSDEFGRYTGAQVVFRPRLLAPAELQQGYWKLYERLFSWPAIVRRIGRNRASLGAYMRGVVLAVNLQYRRHIRQRINPGIV